MTFNHSSQLLSRNLAASSPTLTIHLYLSRRLSVTFNYSSQLLSRNLIAKSSRKKTTALHPSNTHAYRHISPTTHKHQGTSGPPPSLSLSLFFIPFNLNPRAQRIFNGFSTDFQQLLARIWLHFQTTAYSPTTNTKKIGFGYNIVFSSLSEHVIIVYILPLIAEPIDPKKNRHLASFST